MAANEIEIHPVLHLTPVQQSSKLRANGNALTAPSDSEGNSTDIRVWVNTSSRIYHCPGSTYYGRTARGQYMPESAAERAGARPAGGKSCR